MNTLSFLSRHADHTNKTGKSRFPVLVWFLLLFTIGSSTALSAQSLTCRLQVEVGFGPWCKADLVAGQFVTSPSGEYTLDIVGTSISGALPFEVENEQVILNYAYDYVITTSGGVSCDIGTITFRDYSAPACGQFVPIVTTYCTAEDVKDAFTGPRYSDCSTFTMNFTDQTEESCDFPPHEGKKVVKKITRSWTATDSYGNQTHMPCTQTIYVLSPDIETIIADPIVNIVCDKNIAVEDAIDPSNLPVEAVPHIDVDGELMAINAICKYAVVKYDSEPIPYAGNKVKFFRNWQITDWCTTETKTIQQTLLFIDEEKPDIFVQDEVTIEANVFAENPHELCQGIGQLPFATATDNCSEDEDIDITIFIPLYNLTIPNGSILPIGMPLGENPVIYTAKDQCGMEMSATVMVKVVDTTKPIAICTPTKNIGITNGVSTSVDATEFENGSTDNCCIDRFEVRRADDPNGDAAFDHHVDFFCGDDVVQVIFRAYDCAGNFNNCTLLVTVQDLIHPTIVAPEPTEDQCTEVTGLDLTDTSVLQARYGIPVVTDNCSGATFVENTPVINDQDCEGQDILRSFYGVDAYGNKTADTVYQLVTVLGISKMVITFPESTEIDCSQDIPLENPSVINQGCGEIFTRYQDVIYNQDEGACYKIVRTWEVIDWCAFDVIQTNDGSQVVLTPNDNGLPYMITDGYVKYIQEIRVVDNEAPVIAQAPGDIIVELIDDCTGFVTIPQPVVTDNYCDGNAVVTAEIDGVSFAIGSTVSGTHGDELIIKYQAVDGCQNYSAIVETKVTFLDTKKPTPVCLTLSTELGSGGEVVIWANDFESGSSYDNCTLKEVALINKIIDSDGDGNHLDNVSETPPIGQTSITFDCQDQGNQVVQYWIQDMAGNWEFCVTFIYITDADDEDCGGAVEPENATLSGSIQTEDGENIEQVEVKIDNPSMPSLWTGFDGFFNFIGLGTNQTYTVTPKKDIADDNGISTYDMVLLQRHILGVNELNSPYKVMAADVNNSGGISTGDLVEMRKLILGINDELTKTESWKFVPEGYTFDNPSNPFGEVVPESITSNSDAEVGFIGYKMGDLNLNANVSNLLGEGLDGSTEIWVQNERFTAGEEMEITLHAGEVMELLGVGLNINYDTNSLMFEGIFSDYLPGLDQSMYFDNPANNGQVHLAWSDAYATSIEKNDELVTLRFRALNDSDIQTSLSIVESNKSTVVVAEGVELLEKEIITNIKNLKSEIKLYQNQPNPFTDQTMIQFDLPGSEMVTIDILDISGKQIYHLSASFPKGVNQLVIDTDEIPNAGIYYYRMTSGDFVETKKLIYIKN